MIAGIPSARRRLEGLSAIQLSGFLLASVLFPYLAYALGTGLFSFGALALLAALALGLTLWYVVLPASPAADLGFLALVAAVLLRKFFQPIYPEPVPGLESQSLGHLALIHLSALVVLVERRASGTGYGFLPSRRDWLIGLGHYIGFLLIGFPVALWMGAIHPAPVMAVWKIAGTFFGILWVVALSEEFFFRGLLQQWIEQWTGSGQTALLLTAILFGLMHLPFRGFPNWRFAFVAAIAGWFYGRAFRQAQSIRASMVTHALVVTTWRAFFS